MIYLSEDEEHERRSGIWLGVLFPIAAVILVFLVVRFFL